MSRILINAEFENIFTKVCGLTLIERVVFSVFYTDFKEVNIICEHEELKKTIDEIFLKNCRENLVLKYYNRGDINEDDILIDADSVINKEFVNYLVDKKDASRIINIKIVNVFSIKEAEKALLNSCRKPGEAISSHYYRYVSLFFTKYLCKTKITPNQVSFLFLLIGLIGGIFIAIPNRFLYFLGLIFQPLAIVFDCCDGELARLKYEYTKMGEWLDTVCDNLCTLFFVIGISITNYRMHPSVLDYNLGVITVLMYSLAVLLLFVTLMKVSSSGSLNVINRDFKKKGKLASFLAVLLKRNVVTLIFVFLGFFYLTRTLLFLNIIGCLGLIIFSLNLIVRSKKIVL